MIKKVLITIVFYFSLIGCTSLQKEGEEHLENENYSEALDIFEALLEKNHENKKAQAGLRKAQRGWIDKKLLETRRLRMSDNHHGSIELLRKIVDKQNTWDVFPTGAVAFTQKEELFHSRKNVIQMMGRFLKKKKALKAFLVSRRYRSFFQTQRDQLLFKAMKPKIHKVAKRNCRTMSHNLKREQFYYGQFVSEYCGLWNLPKPELSLAESELLKDQYGEIKIMSSASGLPENFGIDLEEKLNQGLKVTPWYHPKSHKTLSLKLVGDYRYEYTRESTRLEHSYTVSVPYEHSWTEQSSANQHKSNTALSDFGTAMSLVGTVLQLASGSFGTPNRVDNGDGTVTYTETRYRDEPRSMDYPATNHLENFESDLALTGKFNKKSFRIVRSEDEDRKTISHSNRMANIGLYPVRAQVTGADEWIKNERQQMAGEFTEKLQTQWKQEHCWPMEHNQPTREKTENVFRCLKFASHEFPGTYENWIKRKFGVSMEQLASVLPEVVETREETGIN